MTMIAQLLPVSVIEVGYSKLLAVCTTSISY